MDSTDIINIYISILNNEIKRFPRGFWEENKKIKIITITKYLIEKHLDIKKEDIPHIVDEKFFRKNKLSFMLEKYFERNAFKAINYVYPGVFKEWEFKNVTRERWIDKNERQKALKWLENKYKTDPKELSKEIYRENNLISLYEMLKGNRILADNEKYIKAREYTSGNEEKRILLEIPKDWIKALNISKDTIFTARLSDKGIILKKDMGGDK